MDLIIISALLTIGAIILFTVKSNKPPEDEFIDKFNISEVAEYMTVHFLSANGNYYLKGGSISKDKLHEHLIECLKPLQSIKGLKSMLYTLGEFLLIVAKDDKDCALSVTPDEIVIAYEYGSSDQLIKAVENKINEEEE